MEPITGKRFNLGQLTNGIDEAMFANAQTTNGVILISNTSNQDLYGMIMGNLQKNMPNAIISPQLINTTNTQGAVYPHAE